MKKFLLIFGFLISLGAALYSGFVGPTMVGPQELVGVTEQQAVTGVYAALTGAEPLAQVEVNSLGTLKVAWPGPDVLWRFTAVYKSIGADGQIVYRVGEVKCGSAELARTFMGGEGWTKVPRELLPTLLMTARTSPVGVMLQSMSGALTTIITLPVLPVPEELQEVQS
jgi:hypothetical protein